MRALRVLVSIAVVAVLIVGGATVVARRPQSGQGLHAGSAGQTSHFAIDHSVATERSAVVGGGMTRPDGEAGRGTSRAVATVTRPRAGATSTADTSTTSSTAETTSSTTTSTTPDPCGAGGVTVDRSGSWLIDGKDGSFASAGRLEQWSPDGTRLVFRGDGREGVRYYVVGVDGSKTLVFQGDPGNMVGNAYWSRDGRKLYLTVSNRPSGVTYEGTVYNWLQAIDIATGAISRVLEWDGAGELWLLDLRGDTALLHTGDGLIVDDLTAAPSRRHTPTIAGSQIGNSGLISPDERHIATVDGQGLDATVAFRDRTGAVVGAPQGDSRAGYLVGWSPDGSSILWGAESAGLERTAVPSFQTQDLGAYQSAAYAPDGSVVYDVDDRIVVVAPGAASGHTVIQAGSLPQVTAAGRITYVEDTKHVCQADLDGTHITRLAIAAGDPNVVLHVPPAGTSVLVIAWQRSDDSMPPYEP